MGRLGRLEAEAAAGSDVARQEADRLRRDLDARAKADQRLLEKLRQRELRTWVLLSYCLTFLFSHQSYFPDNSLIFPTVVLFSHQ